MLYAKTLDSFILSSILPVTIFFKAPASVEIENKKRPIITLARPSIRKLKQFIIATNDNNLFCNRCRGRFNPVTASEK